jgi:hypothetical protein
MTELVKDFRQDSVTPSFGVWVLQTGEADDAGPVGRFSQAEYEIKAGHIEVARMKDDVQSRRGWVVFDDPSNQVDGVPLMAAGVIGLRGLGDGSGDADFRRRRSQVAGDLVPDPGRRGVDLQGFEGGDYNMHRRSSSSRSLSAATAWAQGPGGDGPEYHTST